MNGQYNEQYSLKSSPRVRSAKSEQFSTRIWGKGYVGFELLITFPIYLEGVLFQQGAGVTFNALYY
jgi:hypothetical protein